LAAGEAAVSTRFTLTIVLLIPRRCKENITKNGGILDDLL
jgi:hypothetical protein